MSFETITLPKNISSKVIEQTVPRVESIQDGGERNVLIDMKGVEFVDPAGMVCLLELFRHVNDREMDIRVSYPNSEDVNSYLSRMNFWSLAEPYHRSDPEQGSGRKKRQSDVLLEITPIRESKDIHRVLGAIRERAGVILKRHLNYPRSELDRFLTSLSEVCQNIVEHSGDYGYVAVQKYFYRETLGKNVVKMVVSDLGKGIKNTLGGRLKEKFGSSWNDKLAIEQALFKKASRFEDPGRGHGLTSVRKSTRHWNGRLTLRSGTARVSIVPDWDSRTRSVERDLAFFPGTQVILVLPEQKKQGKNEEDPQKSLFD